MNPKVSVIIPCYNTEKYVEQCVYSALDQDYENIEVIAVDNESTDTTRDLLLEIQKKRSELIVDDAPNLYKYSWDEARNVALEKCSGDYVTFICSDDFLEKQYISTYVKFLNANPKYLAMQSPIRGVQNGQPANIQSHSYSSLENFKQQCLQGCPVNTPTVIYSKKLYDDGLLKTFPEKYYGAADYDLYCRLADNGVIIHSLPMWIGYNYRWHPEQCTWGMHKEPVSYDRMIQDYWRDKWTQV
jgi:glycosyltransferase involved in cell wall biosynthesis